MIRRVAVAVVAGSMATAQVAVEVRIAGPLGGVVADALRRDLGDRAVVAAVPPTTALRAGTVAIGFEFALGASPAAATASPLPWVVRYALVARAEVGPEAETSFESLALQPVLQDRLSMCAPEVDPGPWLLGMAEALVRGHEENAGYGLWTALDARIPGYPADPAAAVAAVRGGGALAAVVARPLLASLDVPTECRIAAIGAVDALGLAAVAVEPVGPDAAELVRQLGVTGGDGELGRICSPRAVVPAAAIAPEDVPRWLGHFAANIQGNGRKVERVADVLDVVFTVLFFGILAAFWWQQRRHSVAASGPEASAGG